MLWQAPEAALFEACAPLGISHVVWSPLAQGVLTGKYRAGQQPPADSRAASTADAESSMRGLVMNDATLEAVERLRPVAEHAGLSLSELALAWVLRRPDVASAITGASCPEQVHANAKASGITLLQDTLDAIDEALADAPVTQPTPAPGTRSGVTHRAG
jgi:aryl-alcohol dehydrogenase-like predicted oxidoreductase